MTSRGFHPVMYQGEAVWKKGTDFLTALQYVKVDYGTGYAEVSAWIQTTGSWDGRELDLTGVMAALPKQMLVEVLDEISHSF